METILKRSSTPGVMLVTAFAFRSVAHAEWNYGIGAGAGWTNAETGIETGTDLFSTENKSVPDGSPQNIDLNQWVSD